MRGIGVVNLVHSDGTEHYPVDIYAPEGTIAPAARPIPARGAKNDHFKEMLVNAVAYKGIKAKTVLFDSWYAAWENLKLVNFLNLTFYTTLKSNRLVSLDKEEGYIHLDEIE